MTTTPCHGQTQTFDSTFFADHQTARQLCVNEDNTPACRFFTACERLADAEERGDLGGVQHMEGTWAGRLYIKGRRATSVRGRKLTP